MTNETTLKLHSKKSVAAQLFWLSFVGLFLELVVIRWLGSEIRAFSIYKNFPLIACYVGLGFGFMRDSESNGRKFHLFTYFPFLLLLFVGLVATCDWTGLTWVMAPGMRSQISFSWWDTTHPPAMALSDVNSYMAISLVVFFFFITLIAVTFAAIGEKLGKLFNEFKSLDAYAIDLIGSTLGILTFAFLSFFCTPPSLWIALAGIPAAWVIFKDDHSKKIPAIIALALAAVIPLVVPSRGVVGADEFNSQARTMWSPYHRFEVSPIFLDKNKSEQIGQNITVNKAFFQEPLNLSQDFIDKSSRKEFLEEFAFNQYNLPYELIKPKRVLVLGSGTGNDVAAALRHGVEHVDAVEIDPLMAKLGHEVHPEKAYNDPRVTVIVNDGRAFLRQNPDKKYDLVLTGLLDSHTVAGNSLSVRLDDYVYTADGLRDALNHVAPGGLLSISYSAMEDYLSKRIAANLRIATGDKIKPVIFKKRETSVWHLMAPVTPEQKAKIDALASKGFADYSNMDTEGVRPSTDDWPFLYLNPTAFDPLYLGVNVLVLALAWLACGKRVRANANAARWQLFFLGSGFLLLELSIIDRLALVFGTTWLVNSICILSVLVAIILSNMAIIKKPDLYKPKVLYAGLIVTLITTYFTPLERFTSIGMIVGGTIAAIFSAIPIFFAGLIFSGSFNKEKTPSVGLAFNMLGAVIGGLLEYVATYTGIRSLMLIAIVIYGISFLCMLKIGDSKVET